MYCLYIVLGHRDEMLPPTYVLDRQRDETTPPKFVRGRHYETVDATVTAVMASVYRTLSRSDMAW